MHFKVSGTLTGNDGTGSIKDDFISKSQSLFIPKVNWQGVPAPGDSFLFSVVSPSYRFWVDGNNYPPPVKVLRQIFHDGSYSEPGNWRIEIFPKDKAKSDDFLHLLYPCKAGTEFEGVDRGIVSVKKEMKGLIVDSNVVMFNCRATSLSDSYHVAGQGMLKHLVVGLARKHSYDVVISEYKTKSVFMKTKMVSSSEGTITFESPPDCEISIAK